MTFGWAASINFGRLFYFIDDFNTFVDKHKNMYLFYHKNIQDINICAIFDL